MFLTFLAITCLIAGLIAGLVAWRGEGRIIAMRDAETLSIADVIARHRAGRLGQLVEVVGTSECDEPLYAPYSHTVCLAYDYTMTEEKEALGYAASLTDKRYHNLIGSGHTPRTFDHNIDLQDNRVPRFYVRDASGRIAVQTTGAKIDMLETMARYESYTGSIANVERQIWHEEYALPLGNRVYVLATLADEHGEPVLRQHPMQRNRHFIISHRDEQSFIKYTRLRTYGLYLLSGLFIGAAMIAGLFALRVAL